MIPITTLVGGGLIVYGILAALIKSSRFIKYTDLTTGVTVIKDKQSGKEYIQHRRANVTELK